MKWKDADVKLPLPALLKEARVSLTMSELTDEEKGMMNGWVKALVSSAKSVEWILTASSGRMESTMRSCCKHILRHTCAHTDNVDLPHLPISVDLAAVSSSKPLPPLL
jgi:hypothetical protein